MIGALAGTVARELRWGLRTVSEELRAWRRRALATPDAEIREDALSSLQRKRENAEGAGLFWILTKRPEFALLRLLVAYQTIWDFLDNLSERQASAGEVDGRQLHLALVEALDPGTALSDYYFHHRHSQDGGYLRTLVDACREWCAALPSYACTRDLVHLGVARCSVQALNHELDPDSREQALREWVAREFPGEQLMSWFEVTAAASAFVPYPLLALAAEPASRATGEAENVHDAYFPSVSLAIAMLDSFADRLDDLTDNSHSYIGYYQDADSTRRLHEIVRTATNKVKNLRDDRHRIIVGCMIAMYLSKASSHKQARNQTQMLAEAAGPLTRCLCPLTWAWRRIHINNPRYGGGI